MFFDLGEYNPETEVWLGTEAENENLPNFPLLFHTVFSLKYHIWYRNEDLLMLIQIYYLQKRLI